MIYEHESSVGIQTVTSSTFTPLVLEGDGPIVVEFMVSDRATHLFAG